MMPVRLFFVRHGESEGNVIQDDEALEAIESVPTALAAFAIAPDSFEQAIGRVILLGGDTDTLAAMTGALSGAYLGAGRLPKRLVDLLEKGPEGRDFLVTLAERLFEAYSTPDRPSPF